MGLFDSIRRVVGGSDSTPEPDDDENPELVDLHNADVEQLREQAEAVADATEDLDFSLASLARLDAAIDRWYDTSVPRADESHVYPIDAVRLGCYLGEVLARVYDGTWSLDPLGVVITGPDGRRTVAVFDVAVQSMTETSIFGGVAALVASEVGFADISRDSSDSDTDDDTFSGLTEATETSDAFAEGDMSAESDLSETDESMSADREPDATVGSASAETPTDTDDAVSLETGDGEVPAVDDEPAGESSTASDEPTDSDEGFSDVLADEEFEKTEGGLTDEGSGDELADDEFGETGDDLSDEGFGDKPTDDRLGETGDGPTDEGLEDELSDEEFEETEGGLTDEGLEDELSDEAFEETEDELTDEGLEDELIDEALGETGDGPTDQGLEDELGNEEFGETEDGLTDEGLGDKPTDDGLGETGDDLSDEGLRDELSDEEFGETGDGLTDEEFGELKETISEQTDTDADDDGTQVDEIPDRQPESDSTLSPPEKPTFESADEPRAQIPTPPVDLPESDDEDAAAPEAAETDASRETRDAELSTDTDEVELTEFDAVTGTASTDDIELDRLVEFDAATEDETDSESDGRTSRSADSAPEATTSADTDGSSTAQSSEREQPVPRTVGETPPMIDWVSHANLPVTRAEVASDNRDEETIPRFEPAEQPSTRHPRTVPRFESADRSPDWDPLCLPRFEPDTDLVVRDKHAIPRFEPSQRSGSVFPRFAPAVGIQDRIGLTRPRFDVIGEQSRNDARVLPQFVATGERRDDDQFVYPQFQPAVDSHHRIEPVLPQFADIEASRMRQPLVLPGFESTTEASFRDKKTVPRFDLTDGNSRSDPLTIPRFTSASGQCTHDRIVPTFEPATTTLSRDGWVLPRFEPATGDRNGDLRISPRFEPGDQPSVEDAVLTLSDERSTPVAESDEQTELARSKRSDRPSRSPDDSVASRRALKERATETDGMVLFDETDEPTLTAPDTTDEHEYPQMADEFVSIWAEYDLDYTPESLGSLDDLVASEWPDGRFEDATYESDATYDDQAFTGVITELGSYFGEVLIRKLDGEWSDETGTDAVIVDSPDERLAVPVFRIAITSFRQQPVFTRSYEALLDDLGLSD